MRFNQNVVQGKKSGKIVGEKMNIIVGCQISGKRVIYIAVA